MFDVQRIKELAGLSNEESGQISINIPDNTSYSDFAKAVAKELKEGYGKHNFKPFLQALIAELKDGSK